MSNTVEAAFDQYTALLELEHATGTKTTRARNDILQSLGSQDLAALALRLKGAGMFRALSGGHDNVNPRR